MFIEDYRYCHFLLTNTAVLFSRKKNSAILGVLQLTDTAISACSTEFREDSGLKTGSAWERTMSGWSWIL